MSGHLLGTTELYQRVQYAEVVENENLVQWDKVCELDECGQHRELDEWTSLFFNLNPMP